MAVRPLSARSVVLSLLLGAHPPELAVRDLVSVGEHFGIAEATLRVALTRMVAAGDLERTDATYRIGARLLERQRRQDAALEPAFREWTGDWETLVVTSSGRSAADRADLRSTFAELRLAELREGVWLRPANLDRPLPDWTASFLSRFRSVPEGDPAELADRLWDLSGWTSAAQSLLEAVDAATDGASRLAVAAALVRHLLTDPALPSELLPPGWLGPALRTAYSRYQAELRDAGIRVTPTG